MMLAADLEGHILWLRTNEVRDKMQAAVKHADDVEADQLSSLTGALDQIDALRLCEAWEFPQNGQVLNTIDVVLQGVILALAQLEEEPEFSIKPTMEQSMDQIASALLQAPRPASGTPAADYRVEFAEVSKAAFDSFRSYKVEADRALDGLRTAEAEKAVATQDLLAALRSDIDREEARVTSQASRLDVALDSNSQNFSALTSEWTTKVEATRLQIEAEGRAQTEILENAFEQTSRLRDKQAVQHVQQLKDYEDQSRNLLSATSRRTISAEYGLYATQQATLATRWTALAIAVASAGFGGWLWIILTGNLSDSVVEAIYRAAVSLFIGTVVALSAKEASGHRVVARDAKRTQLDINALEPFVANMSPEDSEALRNMVANTIFMRPLAGISHRSARALADTGSRLPTKSLAPSEKIEK